MRFDKMAKKNLVRHLMDSYRYDESTGKLTHRKDAVKQSYHNPYKAGDEVKVSYTGQGKYRYPRIVTTFEGKQYQVRVHRLVYLLRYKREPSGYIDHKERNTKSFQLRDTRIVTPAQNTWNTSLHKGCKVQFKGVTEQGKKFRARLMCKGIKHLDESFNTPEKAAKRYDEVARELFGEFGRYNFPKRGERSALIF